ncbi:MAG: hypothetical protein ACI8S6_003355, partial [Myxococcota bacterium]
VPLTQRTERVVGLLPEHAAKLTLGRFEGIQREGHGDGSSSL